jgi:hypothetical protein
MLALDDGALARLMIGATVGGGSWREHSLPKRQHLLLVSGVDVPLNEGARSGGQPLFLTPPPSPTHILRILVSGAEARSVCQSGPF